MNIIKVITTAGLLAGLLVSAHAQATLSKYKQKSDYKSTSSHSSQYSYKSKYDPIKYKSSNKPACWFNCDRDNKKHDYKKAVKKIKTIVHYKCEKYGRCGNNKDVPEPAMLALFGLGLLGVSVSSAVKRRKRS